MLKQIFHQLYVSAQKINRENILDLLEKNSNTRLLDLGCDDGKWSLELAKKIGTDKIYGVDIVDERMEIAGKVGVKTTKANLEEVLPFDNETIDAIHANQVIEHLTDADLFISEIKRVLTPGGYCVISTENLSSWCNIFALLLGWQPFSLTNTTTTKLGLGNPLAINRNHQVELGSWLHVKVYSYRALKEIFENHGFIVEDIKGAGYFPLPSKLGRIDVRHSHFITIKAKKK